MVWPGARYTSLYSAVVLAHAVYIYRSLIAENAVRTVSEAFTTIQLGSSTLLHRLVLPLLVFTQAVPVVGAVVRLQNLLQGRDGRKRGGPRHAKSLTRNPRWARG